MSKKKNTVHHGVVARLHNESTMRHLVSLPIKGVTDWSDRKSALSEEATATFPSYKNRDIR